MLLAALAFSASGQSSIPVPRDAAAAETWSFVVMIVLGVVLIGAAVYWLVKRRSSAGRKTYQMGNAVTPVSDHRRRREDIVLRPERPKQLPAVSHEPDLTADIFRQKVEQLRFSQLPIHAISGLRPAQEFELLLVSDDESLLDAIEQSQDESETDDEVRALALRVLAAFKNRNAVDAISQIALYDIRPGLRAKAVSELANIDHESVFETVLLACADPTKEVRAAAARALFQLTFDRTDAWHRIAESGDELRMRQAARAAIEAGLVRNSFERLVNDDPKIVFEAFALSALLIRAGETEPIFDAIRNDADDNVKLALLHVLRTVKDESVVPGLRELLAIDSLNGEVREKMREVIYGFEPLEV